jgi:DNA-binding MarR family transcriptional regulator
VQSTVASQQQHEELVSAIAQLAAHVNHTSSPALFQALEELDLSFTQVKAAFTLERGERSVGEISAALGLSLPATSRAVDGLAHRGFVVRRESTEDRRSKLVALTPQGRALLEACVAGRRAAMEHFVSALSEPERSALHSALLPIVERITSRDRSPTTV